MMIVIDMNLSPSWEQIFKQASIASSHWSKIGSPQATDREIMKWAREHNHIVFTHDLDFGAILAATKAQGPSVLQLRSSNPVPDHCGRMVIDVIIRFSSELQSGALISLDENRSRISILPIQ